MTSPDGKENRQPEGHTPREEDAQPTLSPCASDSAATVIVTEPESPKQGSPPSLPSLPDHSRFPTPQGLHVGWDPSHISTAKCDLCHRQRCGTIQKCSECKLSICNECCLAGRLQGDARHNLDPDSVTWDAPPSSRKRKMKEGHVPVAARRRKGLGRGRGNGREQVAVSASRSPLAEAASGYDLETPENSPNSIRGYGPVEPRYSVAPTSHYSPQGQYSDTYRSAYSLQAKPAAMTGYGCSSNGVTDYAGTPNSRRLPPISHIRYHAEPPRSLNSSAYRPTQLFPPAGLQSADNQTPPSHSERRYVEPAKGDSDLFDRARGTHHGPPMPDANPNPEWPSSSAIHELGIKLADAARVTKSSNPTVPLDQCLRDEILRTWTSTPFVRMEPDTERAYRLIVAATYFAAVCLNLPPHNAARDWLCQQERSLRDMGYEPIKSNPLTSFVTDVAIQYLQRGRSERRSV